MSVYVFLRFYYGIFGTAFSFGTLGMDVLLVGLGLAGVFVASLAALFPGQPQAPLLAWSSIAPGRLHGGRRRAGLGDGG